MQLIGTPKDIPLQLIIILFAVNVPVPEMEKLPANVCVGTDTVLSLQLSIAFTANPPILLIVIFTGVLAVILHW